MEQTLATLVEIGQAAEESGQVVEALRAYRRALQKDRRCEPAALGMGRLCLLFERYEEALTEFTGVLLRRSTSVEALRGRGLCYFHMGQEARGIEDLTRAVSLDPDAVEVRLSRGQLLEALGDLALAEEDLRHALTLAPSDADVALELVRCLLLTPEAREGDADALEEIRSLTDVARSQLGDDAMVLLLDAELAMLEGDRSIARLLLDIALVQDKSAEAEALSREALRGLVEVE